jgi:hypothetical protein
MHAPRPQRNNEGTSGPYPFGDLLNWRHLCSSESKFKLNKYQDGQRTISITSFLKRSFRLLWQSGRLPRQLHSLQASDLTISLFLPLRSGHRHPVHEVLRTSSKMAFVDPQSFLAQGKTRTEDRTSRHIKLHSFSNSNVSWKRFEYNPL